MWTVIYLAWQTLQKFLFVPQMSWKYSISAKSGYVANRWPKKTGISRVQLKVSESHVRWAAQLSSRWPPTSNPVLDKCLSVAEGGGGGMEDVSLEHVQPFPTLCVIPI